MERVDSLNTLARLALGLFVVTAGALGWGGRSTHADDGRAPTERRAASEDQPERTASSSSLRVQVFDLSGHSLRARLRLRPLGDAPPFSFGATQRAEGSGDTAFLAAGERVISLPPGRYELIATHGPRYSMSKTIVDLERGRVAHQVLYLERYLPARGWRAADLHVHQAPSADSDVPIEDRVLTLAAVGVEFAVPTDHNHVSDYAPPRDAQGLEELGTVPGVEVTTWAPEFGHFNAFPYPRDASDASGGAPEYQDLTPQALFASLHEITPTPLVQVNHPRLEPGIGYFDRVGFDPATGEARGAYDAGYDLLEVWNGYDIARPANVERVFQEWLSLLEAGHRVVATGNSDSHRVDFALAGYPRTLIYAPEGPLRTLELLDALRQGRAVVTNGPQLDVRVIGAARAEGAEGAERAERDALPGDEINAPEGPLWLDVRVEAPPYLAVDRLEIYIGRTLVETRDLPATHRHAELGPDSAKLLRFEGRVEVDVRNRDRSEGPLPVVVRVTSRDTADDFYGRGGVYPMAFSNPIWVRPVAAQ